MQEATETLETAERSPTRRWLRTVALIVLVTLNAAVWVRTWRGTSNSVNNQCRHHRHRLGNATSWLSYNGLSTTDIQVFSSVRGQPEIDALTVSWGKLFPYFHFVVSDPTLADDAVAAPRVFQSEVTEKYCPGCEQHIIVTTRSVNAGIRQTLAIKLWRYLSWACTQALADNRSTPDGTQWMLRVDGDTFVFVPRLLEFLSQFDSKRPTMIAYMWSGVPIGLHLPRMLWPSGGAGVAITQACFKRMCPFVAQATEQSVAALIYDDVMLGVFAAKGGANLIHHEDIFWWRPPTLSVDRADTVATMHDINSPADLKQIGSAIYDVFHATSVFPPDD